MSDIAYQTNVSSTSSTNLPTQVGPLKIAKLHGLQILRAYAAFLVLVDHLLLHFIDIGVLPKEDQLLAFQLGAFGVNIFFTLSAYLMTVTAPNRKEAGGSLYFLRRRIWRIAPLYWLLTLAYTVYLFAGDRSPPLRDLLKSVLFIPYLDGHGQFHPVLGPGWTLDFEMYFYLVYATALVLPGKMFRRVIVVFLIASVSAGYLRDSSNASFGVIAKFLSDPYIIYFILGLLVREVTEHIKFRPSSPPLFFSMLAGISLLVIASAFADRTAMTFAILSSIAVPLLLLIGITLKWNSASLGKFPKVLVALGDASYSIYLTHTLILAAILKSLTCFHNIPGFLIFVSVIAVVGCCSFGLLFYRYFEIPLLALTRPIAGRSPQL